MRKTSYVDRPIPELILNALFPPGIKMPLTLLTILL